jgi:predicted PurR-regulated permease PerM
VLASIWQPIASTGIVLVVLVFVLLEHETLRDRFIRVVGGTNIRLTTAALNDAGERLSRFFVSQFAVNLGVGVTIGLGLALLAFRVAFRCTLHAALRSLFGFGSLIYDGALAIAVDPGWSLAGTLVLFVVVELIAGQAEQSLRHTRIVAASVVVAVIF